MTVNPEVWHRRRRTAHSPPLSQDTVVRPGAYIATYRGPHGDAPGADARGHRARATGRRRAA